MWSLRSNLQSTADILLSGNEQHNIINIFFLFSFFINLKFRPHFSFFIFSNFRFASRGLLFAGAKKTIRASLEPTEHAYRTSGVPCLETKIAQAQLRKRNPLAKFTNNFFTH